MSLTPEQRLGVAAMEVLTSVNRKRLAQARAGTVNTYSAQVPWDRLADLAEELERQFPGWLAATYDVLDGSDR